MRNMVMPLLSNEISKAVRTKLPYFGLFAAALVCLLIFAVADQVGDREQLNAWGYVSLSMQSVFSDIGLICVVVFAAIVVSEETGGKTVRAVLSSAVLRREFYVAKVLIAIFYALLLSVFSVVLSACLAAVRYEFGDICDDIGLVYSRTQVLSNFLLALLLSWLPLTATVLYGIFISTVISKPGPAVAVAVASVYLIDFTKHLIGIDPYVITRYLGLPWAVFHQVANGVGCEWTPAAWKIIAVSLAYIVLVFGAGLVVFSKKDLNV